jgi:DNA-binding transcriptional LysR family regulator
MELRQLAYLVAVAETGNFTRAAARVHVSQPGISAQIRQLERELGAELIDRSGRVATLTPAGRAAIDHARDALAAADALRRAVDEVRGLLTGTLSIGMITGCRITPLFDALAGFHDAHPNVDVTLFEAGSDVLTAQVRAGTTDVALIGAPAVPEGLEALPILSDRLVAAARPDHPLTRRRRLTLATACTARLVCLPVGTGIRAVFDQACARAGVQPDVALEASAPDSVIELAQRGLGVAILAESMITPDTGLVARRLDDVRETAGLALVWRPRANPALGAFLEHARRAFGRAAA